MVNKVKQLNINKLKYWWRKWISGDCKLRRLLVPLRLSELQLCTSYKTQERSRHRCSASRCLTHFFTRFKNIMCTLFYHSSATQSVQELSTHSINRFYCHQPLSPARSLSLYPVQSLILSDLSAGSWWQPNGHGEAQQVFRLSTAQDNVHLVHEAKNVATQASLIHLAEPKEAARGICKTHQLAEGVQEGTQQNKVPPKGWDEWVF